MMPPTPQQISHSSTDESQWQEELAAQSIWSIQDRRRVIEAMEKYLQKGDDMKAEIEALELLMDPEDSEVCLRYNLTHARRRGSRIFDIFSAKKKFDHLVASRNRWSEHEGKRVALQERWQSEWQDVNLREQWQMRSVSRKKDEDAFAAAEFIVNKGGRKPVEFCTS